MTQPDYLKHIAFDPVTGASGDEIWRFYVACHEGNVEVVRSLLSRYPNLVNASIHYHVPLHFALREGHLEVARILLDAKADPFCDFVTYSSLRALLDERRRHDVLQLLDAAIAKRFSVTKEGNETARLIRERKVAEVIALLDADPRLVHAGDGRGSLPLHWAVMTRQLRLIDALLDRGASIDAERPDGARPINLTNGDYQYRGWRDVPMTTLRPHSVLIGYLLAKGAYYDISTAARLGDLERVTELIEADPESVNRLPSYSGYYNSAPLRNAAGQGHLQVVEYLLAHGADPNLPEVVAPDGAALRDAIGGEHWDIVKLLLKHGANPNAMVDSCGNCVWAALEAPEEIRQLLADHGGELGLDIACYIPDYDYIERELTRNPQALLHPYLKLHDRQMVEIALRFQPDILSRCSLVDEAPAEQVEWLIAHGLDVNLPNWLGVTPLHEAYKHNRAELAEVLTHHGARLDTCDDHFKETPLEWAKRFKTEFA